MKKIFIIIIFLLGITFAQEVTISHGKLSIDGLLWLTYQYTKDTIVSNTFNRRAAFLGLSSKLTEQISARIYIDIANMSAYDIYIMYKTHSKVSFLFGQFKLPLGIEVLTKPQQLELIQYSLIGRDPIRTPKGTRDIGIQTSLAFPFIDLTLALVNGNGRNTYDDDNKKCLASRLLIKPLNTANIFIGANYFGGQYNNSQQKFSKLGLELNYTVKPIIFKAEFLSNDDALKGSGYYFQLGYNWLWLQPIFRYSAFKIQNQDRLDEYTFGLNLCSLSDNLKILINYKFEKISLNNKQSGILTQVQFAF
ncbi:MAG: porin [candidate division WOR-3 bacterium]